MTGPDLLSEQSNAWMCVWADKVSCSVLKPNHRTRCTRALPREDVNHRREFLLKVAADQYFSLESRRWCQQWNVTIFHRINSSTLLEVPPRLVCEEENSTFDLHISVADEKD